MHERVLAMWHKVHGDNVNHRDVAASHLDIGNVYDSQGDYENALDQYQKALQVCLAVYGQDHPSVAD